MEGKKDIFLKYATLQTVSTVAYRIHHCVLCRELCGHPATASTLDLLTA